MGKNTVMGFVRLFVICVFVYVHLSLWKRQERQSLTGGQSNIWAKHVKGPMIDAGNGIWKVLFISLFWFFQYFSSCISDINTPIFSVYLMHYPSFLYIYRGMIKNYTKSFDFLHIHYKKVCFIMQKCRKTLQNCELRNVSKFPSDQVPLNTFQQLASVQSISFSQ